MECNRDEATRAKEIAESKFSRKDIMGAKKFALKAQTLYPGLDGITQLLAVLDVYVAAENKINGELDFYGILGVSPLADDKTVRKHYRELALSLHPDKNKSVGADGAFKYISEAFSFLSDKEKRSTYDHKRNGRGFGFKQTQNNGSRAPPPHAHNGFHNFTKTTPAQPQPQQTKSTPARPQQTKVPSARTKDTGRTNSSSSDDVIPNPTMKTVPLSSHVPKTFWTICKRCKLQYEFVRLYLNRNLLCPTCHGPFLANEIPPPNTSTKPSSVAQGVTSDHGDSAKRTTSSKWAPFLKKTGPADVAQAASMVQEAYGKVKRDREEAQAVNKREEALRRKISKWANKLSSKTKHEMNEFEENKETETVVGVDVSNKSNKTRLINKATMEIKKKLNEWSSEENGKEDKKVIDDDLENEMLVIDVPDSDFHDFDQERSEECFKKGQVWAAYDDRDEMPRFYAMIREVVSLDPFKMKICWLNPEGLSPEFLEAFGEFKPGKHDIVTVANYFSHKANFKKQENGNICVFPMKGDVCALYRNDTKPDMEKQNYEIVQVDEYDEETGITVTPLAKVAGFKTVFQRQINSRNNRTRVVLGNEMFRFSHQIPSYMLTGQESENAPKGCCELDPAAIPPEFLEVIRNDKDCVLADFKEGDDVDVPSSDGVSSI